MFELLGGNAGIALGALSAGDRDLALLAVMPYLHTADPTPGGVNWSVRPSPPRSHHIAHGTLGIACALAAVGAATGHRELTELALAGASDVVARNEAGPAEFLVPHSDPQHRPELIERYSYGWCNGPAGDAQVFRLLGAVTKDPAWSTLADSTAAVHNPKIVGSAWRTPRLLRESSSAAKPSSRLPPPVRSSMAARPASTATTASASSVSWAAGTHMTD